MGIAEYKPKKSIVKSIAMLDNAAPERSKKDNLNIKCLSLVRSSEISRPAKKKLIKLDKKIAASMKIVDCPTGGVPRVKKNGKIEVDVYKALINRMFFEKLVLILFKKNAANIPPTPNPDNARFALKKRKSYRKIMPRISERII